MSGAFVSDSPREASWRCDKCGTEYTADIGTCGQLQPPCDGTVRRVESPPSLPPEVRHEPGTWGWFVGACDQEYGRPVSDETEGLSIEVVANGGLPFVAVDEGGDPIWLDEARVRGLILALEAAAALCWPEKEA